MFKKGDKVVLIDDEDLDILGAELYGIYVVEEYVGGSNAVVNILTPLIILEGITAAFAGERFITLVQFRKQKIKKLLSKYDRHRKKTNDSIIQKSR